MQALDLDRIATAATRLRQSGKTRLATDLEQIVGRYSAKGNNGHSAVTLNTEAVSFAPVQIDEASLIPSVVEYIPSNGEVNKLEKALKVGLNILLTGPTGCGKTHLVQFVAMNAKRPMITIQGGAGASYERIVAQKDIAVNNGVPITTLTKGILILAMLNGWILYLDEPNAIPAEVLFYLFSAMDDRREVTLETGEVIKAAKGFTVIGAMNEGYAGTAMLNAAFRQRGVVWDMHYLQPQREAKLLQSRTGIDAVTAGRLADAASRVRSSIAGKSCKTPIGTRALIFCGKLIQSGLSTAEAIEGAIVNQVPAQFAAERKAIADVFAAQFGTAIA